MDLCKVAYDAEDLPEVFYADGNPIQKDLLMKNEIMIPALLVVANKLHFMSTGRSLLRLHGRLERNSDGPFGLILTSDGYSDNADGDANLPDIKLEDLGYSVGIMVNYFCAAARLFKPLMDEGTSGRFNNLHLTWSNDLFGDFEEGQEVTLKQTESMPLITVFYQ